MLLDRIRIK